jgi:repressor LexA
MPPALTEIERKILDYMARYLRANTYQPSIREIGGRFGIKSTKTVSEHLQALADKGYLERDPSRSRAVRILGMDLNAETISVPCYREVPPLDGQLRGDLAEMHLSLDRRIAGAKGAFFVQVRGEELAGLGISDGDFLLVEPCFLGDVTSGQVVVLQTHEGVRYFRCSRGGGAITLHPPQAGSPPLAVREEEMVNTLGRVSALYRRMDEVPIVTSPTAH